MPRRYRIDFALIVLTGNLTRYLTTRPLVERDASVLARWYPIRTWVPEDYLRILPPALRIRLRHLLDSRMLYLRRPAEATVIHAFETYYLYALMIRLLRRSTVLVSNSDGGPGVSRRRLTAWLTITAARRTNLFVPWSQDAASALIREYPWVSREKIVVLHPGIDLQRWRFRGRHEPKERFRLLFIGGDLLRKGADTLLDAFERGLHHTCELHLATQSGHLTPALERRIRAISGVTLYLDLKPGSEQLIGLFRDCEVFVLPTNQDASSWVALEAMATGIPVIICPSGGIPDIIRDGETGLLIPPKDPTAIIAAVDRLRSDPALYRRLVSQGRAHVEQHFDAATNTDRLVSLIKAHIDARRARRS